MLGKFREFPSSFSFLSFSKNYGASEESPEEKKIDWQTKISKNMAYVQKLKVSTVFSLEIRTSKD